MANDSTPAESTGQPEQPFLVTNDYDSLRKYLTLCPAAATAVAYSMTLNSGIILQTRCKRWSCPHCGPRRIRHLVKKVVKAEPNKFVTLTLRYDHTKTAREAYDESRRKVGTLSTKIRKKFGEWEYVRVLEATKRGWPHYHLIVRGAYVPQKWLSDQWRKLTDSYIVDIRPVKTKTHAARYVTKYLYKQKEVPWTDRRVSWSRNFWKPDDTPKPESLKLEELMIAPTDPLHYAFYNLQGQTLKPLGPDAWQIT